MIIIERSWTHIKEITNTSLLVSLHHNTDKSANLEIFDIAKQTEVKKIYSLGEVSGGNISFLILVVLLITFVRSDW